MRLHSLALAAVIVHLTPGAAQAQYEVNVSLPRANFLALEPIPATVIIANRSGADLVLGGPGRGSWLSFEMQDSTGRSLSPLDVSAAQVVKIPAGGTAQQRVVVTDGYAPTDIGTYALTARVLHPPSGQYYSSNRARFTISDAKPLWEQPFGVPEGFKEAGRARLYSLLLFRDGDGTALYFRLSDQKSGLRMMTYRLGPVSMVLDPQITLDRTNRLQVFFLAAPQIFAHCIIKPDGELEKRAYYREVENSRPQLAIADGKLSVIGGVRWDPSAPPPEEAKTRKVSERPPGL